MAKSRREREDEARKRDEQTRAARNQRAEAKRHEDALLEEQMRRDGIAKTAVWQRHGAIDPQIERRLAAIAELRAADAADAERRAAQTVEANRARAEQSRLAHEAEALQRIQSQINRGLRPPGRNP